MIAPGTSLSADRLRTSPSPNGVEFTIFDVVGLAFGALGILWSAAVVLQLQPMFAEMFSEFGGELPTYTRLCLQVWFPLVLPLVPIGVVGAGVAAGAPHRTRAVLMGAAIFLTFALPAAFLAGMYLPLFSLAGAIK